MAQRERISLAELSQHTHRRMLLHFDGCHSWQSTFACEDCEGTLVVRAERDLRDDPYARLWLIDTCERCQALLGGARRNPTQAYFIPDSGVAPCHEVEQAS